MFSKSMKPIILMLMSVGALLLTQFIAAGHLYVHHLLPEAHYHHDHHGHNDHHDHHHHVHHNQVDYDENDDRAHHSTSDCVASKIFKIAADRISLTHTSLDVSANPSTVSFNVETPFIKSSRWRTAPSRAPPLA